MNKLKLIEAQTGTNPVDVRALPYRTRLIAEKIGLNNTYKLLKKFAHRTLYIPSTLKYSDLDKTVGECEAKALIELWPDRAITLPKIDKLFQQWRNNEIYTEIIDGKTPVIDICIKWDLTRQRINQLMHEKQIKLKESKHKQQNLTLDLSL